jgi:hypothetical protein
MLAMTGAASVSRVSGRSGAIVVSRGAARAQVRAFTAEWTLSPSAAAAAAVTLPGTKWASVLIWLFRTAAHPFLIPSTASRALLAVRSAKRVVMRAQSRQ